MSGRDMNALAEGLYEGTESGISEVEDKPGIIPGIKTKRVWHTGA